MKCKLCTEGTSFLKPRSDLSAVQREFKQDFGDENFWLAKYKFSKIILLENRAIQLHDNDDTGIIFLNIF